MLIKKTFAPCFETKSKSFFLDSWNVKSFFFIFCSLLLWAFLYGISFTGMWNKKKECFEVVDLLLFFIFAHKNCSRLIKFVHVMNSQTIINLFIPTVNSPPPVSQEKASMLLFFLVKNTKTWIINIHSKSSCKKHRFNIRPQLRSRLNSP